MAGLRQAFSTLFFANPIVVKELRSRMRGPRAFITLTAVLVLLGVIMYAMLQIILATSRYNNVLSPQVGQYLFAALVFLELGVIAVITPAVTAGAISGEREHQTYEMLVATPLHPAAIVSGKLISALTYVLLLLFAGIPLASVVFIFGGVSLREMVKAMAVLLVIAATYGILGIFLSALFKRTGRATIASFLIVGGLMIGPLFLTLLVAAIRNGQPPRWILAFSPISALSAAIAPSMQQMGGNELFYILGGIFNLGMNQVSINSIPRPMYHYTLPLYGLAALVLFLLTIRLVRPARTWRMRRRETLLSVGTVVLAVGLIAAGFLLTANRYEWAVQPPAANIFGQTTVFTEPARPAPVGGVVGATEKVVTTGSGGEDLPVDEQAQILAAITRQVTTVDVDSRGWSSVYLVNGGRFAKEVLSGVANSLSTLPVALIWVEDMAEIPLDSTVGDVAGGKGVYITYGNIYLLEDQDPLAVDAEVTLHFSNTETVPEIYRLENIDGVWQIASP